MYMRKGRVKKELWKIGEADRLTNEVVGVDEVDEVVEVVEVVEDFRLLSIPEIRYLHTK